MNTLFGKLEQRSIDRLRAFEESALSHSSDGLHVAYSGGKDSEVILELAKRAGVKFKAHHCLTTCDPPEVVRHVRTHAEVEIIKPALTMWQLIRKKGMPPRRDARYCCQVLKERDIEGITVIGIRWEESRMRAKRRMFEARWKKKRQWLLSPIIDWTDSEIWQFIRGEKLPYCCLYDEGFTRIGCVLCPWKKHKLDVQREMERWPKITRAWEKAVKATFKPENKDFPFATPEAYWQWWLDRDRKALSSDENQCMLMFED